MRSIDHFISYLHTLKHEEAGTLAALRRSCGQRISDSRGCQWFASISTLPADFLTATLVAQYSTDKINKRQHHQRYPRKGSIGAAWARYCSERDPDQNPSTFYRRRQEALAKALNPLRPPNIHERFRTLLDAELELDGTGELAYRLRGLVRMLASKDVPIDMFQLADDLRCWRSNNKYVQQRWAEAFYSPDVATTPVSGMERSVDPS